jgi:hypothetical protein
VARNKHPGSTLDDFLAGEGVREEFQARAIKEVVAWQLAAAAAGGRAGGAEAEGQSRRR